ncbi:hypothetical protein MauCBS54593_007317 [Microsporum audouinii]
MEGQGCQQTSSDPPEFQSARPALVQFPRPASFSIGQHDLSALELPSFYRHRQASNAGERKFQAPVIFPALSETVIRPVIYPTNLAASPEAKDKEKGTTAAAIEPELPLTPVKPAETEDFSPSFDCPTNLVIQKKRLPDLSYAQATAFPQWPLHGTRSRYATAPPRAHLHPLPAAPAIRKPIKRRYREVSRERPTILTKLMEQFNVRDWSRPETHPGVTNDKDYASRIIPNDSVSNSSQNTRGEVKIYYPRLKDSESSSAPPKSAPLVQSAADNISRPYKALPVTIERGKQPGLRKISSAPALPRPEVDTEELTRLLNCDVPRPSNIEGIILEGPLLAATQRDFHSIDEIPKHVQVPVTPCIQGTFEGTVAPVSPATMPTGPAVAHPRISDVINTHFERISMAQAANSDAILRSLQGLTNEIRALRVEVRANTNHLHQLNGRVAAVEARLGGLLQPSGGMPSTGYQGLVNAPGCNFSSSQPPIRHPNHRDSQPNDSGPVRDAQRGEPSERCVYSQQHAVLSPRPGMTSNPLSSSTEPSTNTPPPQKSQVISRNRQSDRQRIPRSRDASDNSEWGGTSNWYRKACANAQRN